MSVSSPVHPALTARDGAPGCSGSASGTWGGRAVHTVQRRHKQRQAGGSVPGCEPVTVSREHLPGGLGACRCGGHVTVYSRNSRTPAGGRSFSSKSAAASRSVLALRIMDTGWWKCSSPCLCVFSLSGLVHAWSVDSLSGLVHAVSVDSVLVFLFCCLLRLYKTLHACVVGRVMMPVNRPPSLSNHHTQTVLTMLCTDALGSSN